MFELLHGELDEVPALEVLHRLEELTLQGGVRLAYSPGG